MSIGKKTGKLSNACYRVIRALVKLVYPKLQVEGAENLPEEACIVVGNHSQMHGPIAAELYFPGKHRIWCAAQMMYLKEVPAYAFQDFWSGKPKYTHWFYKLASYVIAPLSVCVFNNAGTIPVFRDTRLLTTFRQTVSALNDGANVVIFPECAEKHNQIVNRFQDKFIDVAKLYYKRTGKRVSFVPMYLAPKRKTMYLGKGIEFDPEAPIEQERARLCAYLMAQITEMAQALPPHRVVPYNNVSKKQYPMNKSCEVNVDREKTRG